MKTPRFFLLLLTVLLALSTPRPAEARTETSFDFFYDSLSPYGEWVEIGDYGVCWRPTEVDADWAPYTDGYWAFTDAGWTWVSYEDFGGIVYHYGRWVRVEDEGWCWVPDYEWGPAWVSWRNNDDYVGWAPLPPEVDWQPSVGISIWVDRDYDIGPGYYNFCRVRDFGAPVLRPVIINRIENITIIRRTVNCTNITYNNHYGHGPVIYNGGPSYDRVNERSSRRIPALKLVQNDRIDLTGLRDQPRGERRRNFNSQAVGNQLVVSAPVVRAPEAGFLKPKRTLAANKVTRGWNSVKNEDVRRELKQEMQKQTRGLTRETTPARAVATNDLKVLPEKADPQAAPPAGTRGDRERPDRKGRNAEVATQPPGVNAPEGRMKPATETGVPPAKDEKTAQEKSRGPGADPRKPADGEPGLKPFNPATDGDPKSRRERDPRVAKPGDEPGRRDPSTAAGRMKTEQEAAEKQAEGAALQQKQQMEAQRQAEALRQQQKEAAATARQRMQAEQGSTRQGEAGVQRRRGDSPRPPQDQPSTGEQQQRRAQEGQREQLRQRGEAAAAQQKQAEAARRQQGDQQAAEQQRRQAVEQQRGQRDAAEQARRAQEGQRQQAESARRQQGEQQAAEQQRRQAAEQQRGQREAAEQARRAQESQRPPAEAPRMRREAPQAAPQTAPPAGTPPAPEQERRERRERRN